MTQAPALEFQLQKPASAEGALLRGLTLWIRGRPVWPVSGDAEPSVEIHIDDLLSYLTEFWKPLLLRQTYPFLGSATSPSDYLRRMENRWQELPETLAGEEAETVQSFEEAHNLALQFAGQFDLPPFWLIREQGEMLCETAGTVYRLPFEGVVSELCRVGSSLAASLAEASALKWASLIEAWESRDAGEAVDLLAWTVGLAPAVARTLVSDAGLVPPKSVSDAANDDDPLRIAARLAGELPTEQIVSIIELARSFAAHQAERLEKLSGSCVEYLEQLPRRSKPFQQGEEIARHVRALNDISPSDQVDVFALVKHLGVEVRVNGRAPENLEGLAIAGKNFGPGAYVNTKAKRPSHYGRVPATANPALRLTLAHELCHLLLDQGHAMTAVEVLQNRMSPLVEARAKSFAAELLLPSTIAAKTWDEAGSPLDERRLTRVLKSLARDFGVSLSVAAWKIEHGAWNAPPKLRTMLSIIAPKR